MATPIEFAATLAALPEADPGATISPLALQASAELATAAGWDVTLANTVVAARHDALQRLPRVDLATDAATEADLQLVGVIGQGGMGRVDTAIQRVFGRTVAVKRVRTDRMCPASVAALVREATVTGLLDHPNIVPAHIFGQTAAGEPVLVMKLIGGVAWDRLIADPAHAAWHQTAGDHLARHVEILIDVCQAVEAAHRRGIAHCDLKPANVMVGDLGEVYVLDWGVAVRLSHARSSELAGTPAYMAPEMLRGSVHVTPATDVYLLGAILYELLTGQAPHRGTQLAEALQSVAGNQIAEIAADGPAELADICRRALASDPAQRWPSALALRDALVEYMGHRGSMELVATGRAALEALHTLLGAGAATAEVRAQWRSRAAEAEFAFRQALRSWPGNTAAALGCEEVLTLAVDLELAAGNGAGAEAALRALAAPPPELVRRVEALLVDLAARERAQIELAQFKHERNFSAAALTPIVSMALGSIGLLLSGLWLDLANVQVSSRGIMLFWIAVTIMALGMVYRQRSKVLVNEANRNTQISYVTNLLWTLTSTVLCWAIDLPAVVTVLVGMVVMGQGVAQAAVWGERSVAVYLIAVPAAATAAALWPDRPFRAYVGFAIAALAGAMVRWYTRRKAGATPG